MIFSIHSDAARLDHSLIRHEILGRALSRYQQEIDQVTLNLAGLRGAVLKECRCVLHLRRMQPIVIRDRDESVHALLQRVADRAAYAVSQRMDRRNKRRRKVVPSSLGTTDGHRLDTFV